MIRNFFLVREIKLWVLRNNEEFFRIMYPQYSGLTNDFLFSFKSRNHIEILLRNFTNLLKKFCSFVRWLPIFQIGMAKWEIVIAPVGKHKFVGPKLTSSCNMSWFLQHRSACMKFFYALDNATRQAFVNWAKYKVHEIYEVFTVPNAVSICKKSAH